MVLDTGSSVVGPPDLQDVPMPSLIRLLLVLGLLGGLACGAVVLLAIFVEPKAREITMAIPQDRLNKHR